MAAIRAGLFREIVSMSLDTLRTSKMRSALTVLGVVIGITSIVGMTALIRGFDESLRDSIRALGPNTVFVQKFSALSFAVRQVVPGGGEAPEHHPRGRARGRARVARRSAVVDVWLGGGGNDRSRVYYGHEKTTQIADPRRDRELLGRQLHQARAGPAVHAVARSSTGARSSCSARTRTCRSSRTSIRSARRCGSAPTSSRSIGVFGKRPSPGGFGGADDFVVIPFTAQEKFYGKVVEGALHRRQRQPARRSAAR